MRSLILCEGFDDVLILGYYLHKTQGWNFNPKARYSKMYNFPKQNVRRQVVEIYEKDDDLLGIWAVGGKDSFGTAYKFLYDINTKYPEEGIEKVFVMTDRDQDEVDACLKKMQEELRRYSLNVSDLQNNQENDYSFEVEDEMFCMKIIPVIVPFDKSGALETVLMDGISESGVEEQYIVECANQYVDGLVASNKLHSYLQHARQELKARFSAVISITNPDRSTALFDQVLMSWNWKEKDAVHRHFETIIQLLSA